MRSLLAASVLLIAGLAAQAGAQDRLTHTVDVEARDRDLREVLAEVSRRSGRTIVLDARVRERVTLSLRQVSWRDAVEVLARRARCTVEVLPGGGLLLTRPERITVELVDADVRTALLLLARFAERSVVLGPEVQGRVTLSLREVEPARAFEAVARTAGDFAVVADGALVTVGAGRGAAPAADDPAVLAGELVSRHGDVVVLRLDGGGEIACRAADDRVRDALGPVRPGDRVVVAVTARPGEATLTITSLVADGHAR